MNERGNAGLPPEPDRKPGRRKLVLAVVISCVIIPGIAGGTYLLMPRTVHFYAMNDSANPVNVTLEVDGSIIIKDRVSAESNGVVGVVERSAIIIGGFHSMKFNAPELGLSASQTFDTYGGLYMLIDFSPGAISVEFLDHAPLFL